MGEPDGRGSQVSARGAVFVDRDGVINELVPDPVSGRPESPLRPDDLRLVPGASAALGRLATAGWRLVGVSNQPAAAKGLVSVQELQAVHARMMELLAAEGVRFDAFKLCLHHPEGVVPELMGDCECRKPAPGMLLEAARELDARPGRFLDGRRHRRGRGRGAGGRVPYGVGRVPRQRSQARRRPESRYDSAQLSGRGDRYPRAKGVKRVR